ncbi:MAG: septal ring lytic transglycosylase RlpA family protein [Rickettsiales bacterium]|nr:septal ring lytic transglycosylase RlpA family protein [Rickettsiales bacterium]
MSRKLSIIVLLALVPACADYGRVPMIGTAEQETQNAKQYPAAEDDMQAFDAGEEGTVNILDDEASSSESAPAAAPAARAAPAEDTAADEAATVDEDALVEESIVAGAEPAAAPSAAPAAAIAPAAASAIAASDDEDDDDADPDHPSTQPSTFGTTGLYKVGNPYLIDGVPYYPHEDYEYSEIGTASWYGDSFHGQRTANGEVFDKDKLTAAHRTLPMPSLVRVTNMDTGVSVNVKVNDRGPFARDRIIDLSSAAADALDMKATGTARVKVEILAAESRALKRLAMESKDTSLYDNYGVSVKPGGGKKTESSSYNQSNGYALVGPAQAKPAPEENIPEGAITSVASVKGGFYVQAAAFYTFARADGLKAKLSGIGPAKIFKAVQDGEVYYKVRFGEFGSKDEAVKVQKAVREAGIQDARIIQKADGSFKWDL